MNMDYKGKLLAIGVIRESMGDTGRPARHPFVELWLAGSQIIHRLGGR
jgi:hypothetical protein